MNAAQQFGAHIRRLRVERGWSQADLLDRLREAGRPMSQPTLGRLEAGTRDTGLDEVAVLAQVFEVTFTVDGTDVVVADRRPHWRIKVPTIQAGSPCEVSRLQVESVAWEREFAQAIQERLNAMLDRIQQATDGGAE